MDPYFERLPLTDQPLVDTLVPAYRDWLSRPERDAKWRATAISERYGSIDVPALHIGGWSDIFLEGTIRNYVGLRAGAATEAAREGQRLVIGPWAHGNPHEVVGELDHGPAASQLAVDMTSLHLAFFEAVLRGESPPGPPVRIFTMGANAWRDEDEWPIARTRVQRLYLRGGGRANGAAGDGGLSAASPGDEPPDHYVYNPRDPVPTVGGCTLLPSPLIGVRSGPRDQRAIEARGDVLVYTERAAAAGHRGHRRGAPDAGRRELGAGHGLDGEARRRPPRRAGDRHRRRHPARPLPRGARPARAAGARASRRASRSCSARPACCSAPGTASGCRSRARTSRASRATRTSAATWPPRRRPICAPRCRPIFHDAERASYLELPIVPPRA